MKSFKMINNYIYLYHVQQFIILPTFPETISDSTSVSFEQSTPMSRSAPIYSYRNSGPRSLQVKLNLHRDLMNDINRDNSTLKLQLEDDYVDTLIKQLQAVALPNYNSSKKLVDPPQVAVRFGNEIFIKGIVSSDITTDYNLPILRNNKYALVSVSFTVSEVDPYNAVDVMRLGSFRGPDANLERNIWRT